MNKRNRYVYIQLFKILKWPNRERRFIMMNAILIYIIAITATIVIGTTIVLAIAAKIVKEENQ